MIHKRIIYIDPKIAKEACESKEALEALAVVLSIKITFVDSIIRDASTTRLMNILRVGHARCKRAISYALKRGWLKREGNNLIAGAIKSKGSYNVKIVFSKCSHQGKRENFTAAYKLTELCNFIRQALLINHISKSAVVYDTLKLASCPTRRDGLKEMKRAKKRLKRWDMCEARPKKKAERLSYARMSELCGCSLTKAKSLIKSLVVNGKVNKRENFKKTNIPVEQFCEGMRQAHIEQGKKGFLCIHGGAVCVRFANSYSLNVSPVRFIRAI